MRLCGGFIFGRSQREGRRQTDGAQVRKSQVFHFRLFPECLACYDFLVTEPVDELQMGEHAALFYRTKTEQLSFALPFVVAGLKRNERCIYIAVDNSVLDILRRLDQLGVDTARVQREGALQVVTKNETYLRHGAFEPEKMVDDFHKEAERALEEGFTGLRATGEMSWALDLPSTLPRLLRYEEALYERWPAHLLGLCQYDESRFPEAIIEKMEQMHKVYVRNGRIIRKSLVGESELVSA